MIFFGEDLTAPLPIPDPRIPKSENLCQTASGMSRLLPIWHNPDAMSVDVPNSKDWLR
jgi:hypothetical protein